MLCVDNCFLFSEFLLPMGWHGGEVDGFDSCVVELVSFFSFGNEYDLVI